MNQPHPLQVSIVTPSFNQAAFLERCLHSVRMQTVPACEHLVFDPGSSDGSRDIARSYPGVTLFEEPDDGQADAVGKGFARVRGDIIGWLNSDDEYADPGVFEHVANRFAAADQPDLVYGRGVWVDADGTETRPVWMNEQPDRLLDAFQESVGIAQPAVFLRRTVVDQIGLPDKRLHFALDYEYWIRAVQAGLRFAFLDRVVAKLRYYPTNKTAGKRGESYAEICKVVKEKYRYVPVRWLRRFAEFNLTGADGIMAQAPGDLPKGELEREVDRLAQIYNLDRAAITVMNENSDREPYKSNLHYHRRFSSFIQPPWREIPGEQKSLAGHQCYTVGETKFAFKSDWLARQLERTRGAIEYFRRTRRSDTCIVVGNGPSLNAVDFDLLRDQDVFASNYAFLHKKLSDKIRFLSVVNYTVAEQGSFEFQGAKEVMLLLPYWLRYAIHEADNVFFFKSIGIPEFSKDLIQNVSWRSTVTFFNLQLAYGLGYRRVLMIGFDHSYVQSSGLKEGDMIKQTSEDVNHFSPYYFYNKQWQAADTAQMEQMYRLAKGAFESDGREIVNCTHGGRLELFRRSTLEAELNGSARLISAVG